MKVLVEFSKSLTLTCVVIVVALTHCFLGLAAFGTAFRFIRQTFGSVELLLAGGKIERSTAIDTGYGFV